MIRGKLLLCAEGVSIDVRSNNVTIFNIIEQINLRYLPAVFPKMVIYGAFERDDGDPETFDGELHIRLEGIEVAGAPVPVEFQGKKATRSIITLGGLPIMQPGKMEISIYEKGKEIKVLSYSIEVTVPKKPEVEQSAQSE